MKIKKSYPGILFLKRARRNGLLILIVLIMIAGNASGQNKNHYMRIAKIVVDPSQLENYKAALKEEMKAAVSKEPGVLSLYAVYEKANPTHITEFETYADEKAYQSHIQSSHFKKYKSTVQNMVKSLELTDVVPIALESKTRGRKI